ncbi:ORF6C domain-containing protein [Lactococcus lactis]|uniref:ORF6C domain-containing protein n=1 Tax=Lactococcus lactis TaxID=1358 RepID=UPI003DA9BEA1
MNQLIRITQNKNKEQVVSARELHKILGVKKRFSEWWKENAKLLVEHEDYEGVLISTPYNPRFPEKVQQLQDYAVTADNAKHLAMQSQTKKSREIRDYFIACEKELKLRQLPMTLDQQIAAIATGYGSFKQELVEVQDKVTDLTERFGLPATNAAILKSTRNIHIIRFLGGKGSKAYHELGRKVFSEFGRDFKDNFGVPRYDAIPLSKYDEAIAYTKSWQPSYNTMISIRNTNMQIEFD